MEPINFIGREFFDRNPARTPQWLPLAQTAEGKVWNLPLNHHTLIAGDTATAKSAVLHGVVRQLAPFVKKGTQLFGIDPRHTELRPYEFSNLFELQNNIMIQPTDVLTEVRNLIHKRLREYELSFDASTTPRSSQHPLAVVLIDELGGVLLDENSRTQLKQILAVGRSVNVLVVAATQMVSDGPIGRLADQFGNVALFRQRSEYLNDRILGAGAADRGHNSTAIPLSTKANCFQFAGQAFIRTEGEDPTAVRFGYLSDEDIVDLVIDNPNPLTPLRRRGNSPAFDINDIDG